MAFLPNDLRYLRVGFGEARQHKITFSAKWPPHTRADCEASPKPSEREGGQVVGSGNGAWGLATLVSIPCHIEPDMRFSLIRLSDNLLPAAFKA